MHIETNKMCLFKSQILFYQRAGTVDVNAIDSLD